MKKKLLSWLLSGALFASTLTVLPVANLTSELTANAAVTCSDWDDVVDAIEDCPEYGFVTIELTGNITADEQIEIEDPCTIRFLTSYTITDTTDESLFYLDEENITLDFGDITLKSTEKSDDEGGAVYVNDKNCMIIGGTFNDYKSEEDGGAIYVNGDKCSIGRNNFNNCESDGDGGAIYVDNVGCTISDCQFRGCKSKGDGGAIYMNEEGTISICGFNECEAEGQGGAICNGNSYGGDLLIDKCYFAKCLCKLADLSYSYCTNFVYGNNNACVSDCNNGEIFAYYNVKKLDFSTEKGHVAHFDQLKRMIEEVEEGQKLDIYIDNDLTFLEEIEITKKCEIYLYAPQGGCAFRTPGFKEFEKIRFFYIDAEEVKLYFKGTITFVNVGYTGDAAAIYVNDDNCLIDGATFNGCKLLGSAYDFFSFIKNWSGGAIYVNGKGCTISNCTFKECSAQDEGGAICVNKSDCTIEKCEFSNCKAEKGGAIYVNVSVDNCSIQECTFSENTATKEADSSNVHGRSDTKLIDCKMPEGTYTGCEGGLQTTTASIFSDGNVWVLFIIAEAATVAITILVTMNVMKKKSK